MRYKNVGSQIFVIPNVGEFKPGEITPDLTAEINNSNFEAVETNPTVPSPKPVVVPSEGGTE
jgi:hypothetical protein